jgi:tetratricopeptide (TPR) repeat protein
MTTNNIAFALLAGRRYAEAVPHTETALAYFEGTRQPYWQSLSAGNLAEAYAHLNRLDEAESLLWRALSLVGGGELSQLFDADVGACAAQTGALGRG